MTDLPETEPRPVADMSYWERVERIREIQPLVEDERRSSSINGLYAGVGLFALNLSFFYDKHDWDKKPTLLLGMFVAIVGLFKSETHLDRASKHLNEIEVLNDPTKERLK